MAKMEKMDPKEMPKVIGLGVVAVGMFGYFAMQMVAPPKRPPAPAPGAEVKTASATAPPVAGAEEPGSGSEAVKGLIQGNVFNPDPFAPTKLPRSAPQVQPGPSVKPAPGVGDGGRAYRGPSIPAVGGGIEPGPGVQAGTPGMPAVPAPPVQLPRPELMLTGVIDSSDGPDLAVAQLGTESVILKVGDKLPNDYKIVKVILEGEKVEPCVWITNAPKMGRKDLFKVTLGGRTPVRDTVLAVKS
jgi:hypothetical protein